MSREILFRAKRVSNGMWAEGDLNHCILIGAAHICSIEGNLSITTHRVDSQTICQYTGLTDKHGRRYEGDIFQADDGENMQRYIIAWNEDSLEWSAECITDPEGTLPLSEFKLSEIEVIGNIFDNPELLEGGAG